MQLRWQPLGLEQVDNGVSWRCRCREILRNSPTALRVLKSALNAAEDGQAGLVALGGDATALFYQTEEGNEVLPLHIDCFLNLLLIF